MQSFWSRHFKPLSKLSIAVVSFGSAAIGANIISQKLGYDDGIEMIQTASASGLHVTIPKLDWPHSGVFASLDHASVRRGYQVYRQVCAACHSMNQIRYRHLINVCRTIDEAKADAAEDTIEDGPDDDGNYFTRPRIITDRLPSPYANEEAAKAANNGALPPDLSLIIPARHGNENYVFHLLTGYTDAPAGMTLGEGQHYNPYMAGGIIGMQPPLYDEVIEYDDGTPATTSQLAKDVCEYLLWASDPNYDPRMRFLVIFPFVMIPLILSNAYSKRWTWSTVKTRVLKHHYKPPPRTY